MQLFITLANGFCDEGKQVLLMSQSSDCVLFGDNIQMNKNLAIVISSLHNEFKIHKVGTHESHGVRK